MMKKLYILVAVVLTNIFCLSAQITMNYSTHGILQGDVYKFFYGDTTGFDPGVSGANKTWNFSALTIGSNLQIQNYIDPATTPYAASFPTATFALEQSGSYAYYKASSLGTFTVGAASTTVTLPYPDDEKMFVYPFTYLTTFSDYFSGEAISLGVKYKRFGQITTTGDGWGKVTLGGTTFNNVLRVKIEQTITDYQIQVSTGDTILTTLTKTLNYHWYRQNFKDPLINYTYIEMYLEDWPEPIGTNKMIFIDNDVTGIEDNSTEQAVLNVFPNPAKGFINLETSFTHPQKLNVEISNAGGQQVYASTIQANTGRNVQKLDVSTLPEGIYTVRMYNEISVVVKKLILQ
jgi:hypothetical protein